MLLCTCKISYARMFWKVMWIVNFKEGSMDGMFVGDLKDFKWLHWHNGICKIFLEHGLNYES